MASKTGMAKLSEGRSDLLKINPYNLHVLPSWNLRDMTAPDVIEHIDMLAQSIAEIGVQVPLRAYWEDGKAFITSGHCRLEGALRAIEHYKAELKTVPVQIEDRYSNEADRVLGQITHNSGKPFTQLEQAKVFKKLVDLGWQQQEIAKKVGISSSRVSQIMNLLTLPESVKSMVTNGQVSATMATQVVAANGPTAAEKALRAGWEQAKAEGATKVKPEHVEATGATAPRQTNLKTMVKEAFEYADVDDEAAEFVVIKMPTEHWEKIRQALEL